MKGVASFSSRTVGWFDEHLGPVPYFDEKFGGLTLNHLNSYGCYMHNMFNITNWADCLSDLNMWALW